MTLKIITPKGPVNKTGGGVDSAQSTVSATSPVSLGAVSVVTVTAKTAAGTPVQGVSVSIAVSGTGNSITQPTAVTNASGVATASFTSTVGETKIITATAGGTVITQHASVIVQVGVTPWFEEDFSTYTSTANMISDPRGIYSTFEDQNTAQMVLDKAVGFGSLLQSMRFDYTPTGNASGPGDFQITRDLVLPSTQAEVWVESVEKGSTGFTVAAWPGYTGAAAWKHFFGRVHPDGNGRFSTGSLSTRWVSEYPPGGQELDTGTYAATHDPGDNQWHVFRYHWKCGANGALQVWQDGVLLVDQQGVNVNATDIYGISIGQTFNNGPIQNQSYWWGRIRVYITNPGW